MAVFKLCKACMEECKQSSKIVSLQCPKYNPKNPGKKRGRKAKEKK